MRNILFRGKRLDNGEWVEGGFFKTDDECYIITNSDGITFFDLWDLAEFVIPETIGQYTGLTINGKKIFEGDIVKVSICYDVGCYPHTDIKTIEVKIPDIYKINIEKCIEVK